MRQQFDGMAVGANVDQAQWDLPPNIWTEARNVRFRDGATETFTGQQQVFGTTIGRPWRLLPISDGTNVFWVYCGPFRINATDGVSHGNITPAGGLTDISATNVPGWSGGAFQGFMVLANGVDNPQTWTPGLLNQCVDLANWPATLDCQVMRPYRNYLFALRCSESGTYNPRLLRWGSSANPASLPDSWDYTDPTNDSGRVEFGQTQDQLIDLLPMRDSAALYKENYTWSVQFRGGIDNPFVFRQAFSQIGMLSEWCAAPLQGRHVVLSTNDLVIHDLNQAHSIIDKSYRSWLFNQIDSTNYRQSFIVPNYKEREIWVCFPSSGSTTFADLALVWNYQENSLQVRELGAEVPHIGWGVVSEGGITTFEDLSGTFDDQVGVFDQQQFNPSTTSLLISDDDQLFQGDEGGTFGDAPISAYWERDHLPLDKDVLRFAHVKRIYPKVQGAAGDTLNVQVGTRMNQNDDVAWSSPRTFTVGTDTFVNFREMGRVISVRFEHNSASRLRMHGFDVEWDQSGYH